MVIVLEPGAWGLEPSFVYPCLCLCFWFVQMMRTTPRRRTTLHLSHIRFTEALTFIVTVLALSPSVSEPLGS